jgi:hypothetical protein
MEDRVAVMVSVFYSDPAQWEGNAFLASERFVLFNLQFRPVLWLWYFYVLLCKILVLKILFCAVGNSFLIVKFIMRNYRVLPFFILFIYNFCSAVYNSP